MKTSASSRKRSKRSRARKRRLVAVVVFFVIAFAVALLARTVFAPRPVSVTVAQTASPTAAPTPSAPPWTSQDVTRVRLELNAIFARAVDGARGSSLVVLDQRGSILYAQNAAAAITPASVQKLIVAYCALNELGASYRYDTILAGSSAIRNDGNLDGSLWLVGSGDPSFRSGDLQNGVQTLQRNGLHSISGDVAVDAASVSGVEINPNWDVSDANEDFQTATSGASIDGDTVEFRVYGTASGEPARVVTVPQNSAISVSGEVETGGGDDVTINSTAPNIFRLSGSIPPGSEEKFWLPVHDIPHYAAAVLARTLTDAGVSYRGTEVSAAPLDSVNLWMHRSAPLTALVKHMLYFSDNHYAEQLLRTLGGETGTADDAAGIARETEFLRSRNIPIDGMHVVDGSGLAEKNRVSALTLARMLNDSDLRGGAEALYPVLAGSHQGTLKHYGFTAAAGRVHAKTGHLSDADSLAGYITTMHHGRLAFAFMINNSPGDPDSAYIRALDTLAEM